MVEMDKLHDVLDMIKHEHRQADSTPIQYKCSKCKDTGFVYSIDESGYANASRCECFAIRQAKEMMKRSGISDEFQKKSFENFDDMGNRQLVIAKSKAKKYVNDFDLIEHTRYNSIMFCGQVGAGKTHLGISICGELMNKGIAVVYMAYRNAITKIKQNVTDEECYDRELNKYISARVLYIDDLLKGKRQEADINVLYTIVNHRYMNNLPIIISTEISPNELLIFDEAIGSRLWEMCRGNIVYLQGKELNYRLRR